MAYGDTSNEREQRAKQNRQIVLEAIAKNRGLTPVLGYFFLTAGLAAAAPLDLLPIFDSLPAIRLLMLLLWR